MWEERKETHFHCFELSARFYYILFILASLFVTVFFFFALIISTLWGKNVDSIRLRRVCARCSRSLRILSIVFHIPLVLVFRFSVGVLALVFHFLQNFISTHFRSCNSNFRIEHLQNSLEKKVDMNHKMIDFFCRSNFNWNSNLTFFFLLYFPARSR